MRDIPKTLRTTTPGARCVDRIHPTDAASDVLLVEVHFFPSRAIVIDGAIVFEQLTTVRAPQLSASEAPGDADIIDIGIVLTITGLRAAARRAVTDHDLIDEVFAVGALLKGIAEFANQFRFHASKSAPDGRTLFPSRFRFYFSLQCGQRSAASEISF